jgi:hypothetical protein
MLFKFSRHQQAAWRMTKAALQSMLKTVTMVKSILMSLMKRNLMKLILMMASMLMRGPSARQQTM